MRKLLAFILAAGILLCAACPAIAAEKNYRIVAELYDVTLDVPPLLENSRLLLPVRPIAEAFAWQVDWDGARHITIANAEDRVELWLGSTGAMVNGREYKLDAVPVVQNGRTFLPVRFIAEALGKKVRYEANMQTAEDRYADFVWLTSFDLLTAADISADELAGAWKLIARDEELSKYALVENASTRRGIALGDEMSKVKELYGEPKTETADKLVYWSEFIPESTFVGVMTFEFKEGRLAAAYFSI